MIPYYRGKRLAESNAWYRTCNAKLIPFVEVRVSPVWTRLLWDLLPAGVSYLESEEREIIRRAILPFIKIGQFYECGAWSLNRVSTSDLENVLITVLPALEEVVSRCRVRALLQAQARECE